MDRDLVALVASDEASGLRSLNPDLIGETWEPLSAKLCFDNLYEPREHGIIRCFPPTAPVVRRQALHPAQDLRGRERLRARGRVALAAGLLHDTVDR